MMQLSLKSLALLPALGSANLVCGPAGPIFPRPSIPYLSSSSVLQDAAANLTSTLDAALQGTIKTGWETANVSFSLALISANQTDPRTPIWEYHHRAATNERGVSKIDKDSQWLIGSISKLVSDYVMLQTGVDIDTPVTEILPKLAETPSKIRWEEITLRMLASQLAGIPANYGFSEYYFIKDLFVDVGFPPVNVSEYPPCGVIALNQPCTSDQLLDGMRSEYPVTGTNQRPSYSNSAFSIIFRVIKEQTGKNYTQLVDELFSKPMGLSNTMPSPGDDNKAVIPSGESSWGSDYGDNAPQGGLVSSISDLTAFSHNILSRKLPMIETEIRGWLKPSSIAGNPSTQVGMPWEIYQTSKLTPDHPHPIAVYSKGGGAIGYRSQLSLVDDYGVGFVALTAGPMDALIPLNNALISVFVPAIDKLTRQHAEENYAVTFQSDKSTDKNTSVTATFTQDQDSLILTNLTRGNKDVLSGIVQIWNYTVGQYVAPVIQPVRLFPEDLNQYTTLKDGTPVTVETWHLWPSFDLVTGTELPGVGLDSETCFTWTIQDWVHYGGEPTDRIEFYRDGEGKIVGLEVPFLRSGVLRPN